MALLHCDFHSDVLELACSMTVILPQQTTTSQIGLVGSARSTDREDFRGHPTLWLLHGMSDDHTIWPRRTSIERYVAPRGLAVVMPAVARSYYTDMHHGPKYWTFISEELPRIARSFFHLSDRREDNFVAGLSMGGYGAFKLALVHPDRYAAAASLSGALDAHTIALHIPDREEEMTNIFGPSGRIRGSENDLFTLAERLTKRDGPRPALYQCCGTEDFLHADNRRFREHLAAVGLDVTYEEGPGSHEWGFWDQWIQRVVRWLPVQR
jgi:putative tributyrin esterase